MNAFFRKNHRLVFYLGWIILGLIQSRLTELQDDEAYYWVYSKYLAWGYFDHPPMIAILVKIGYAILPNELGVRLFPLLLNVFSLMIIEKLVNHKNAFLFYSISLSIAVLQLAGFMAVPDIPLIFFTSLFFLTYKSFSEKQSIQNILLLALSISLLFYTKYHAILIVLFTLFSNTKLFTKPALYMAAIIAFLLYFPHLLWQWQHNWVSFRYHLFESNVDPYKLSYTTEYLAGQLLIAGPIAGLILLPAAFSYKIKTPTEKGLKWTMIGIYIFFFLSSFRGKVEPNWTSPALVPLIVLSHQYINENRSWRKWIFRLLPVSIVLVCAMRIAMIADLFPLKAIKKRYHAWKDWPEQMKEKTKGLPVVFSNSYQRASKYWFYSGQITYSQNNVREHRNNYNFWPVEDRLLGKPIYFLDIYGVNRFPDSLKTPIGYVGYKYDSVFNSFAKIEIRSTETNYKIGASDSLVFRCHSNMPYNYGMYLDARANLNPLIKVFIFNKKKVEKEIITELNIHDLIKGPFSVTIHPNLPAGSYDMRFSIEEPGYNATHNSEKIGLIVK